MCQNTASPGAKPPLHVLHPRQAAVVVQLLAYRRGEHSPEPALAGVDAPFRELVLHMTQLDPGAPWRAWGGGSQKCTKMHRHCKDSVTATRHSSCRLCECTHLCSLVAALLQQYRM